MQGEREEKKGQTKIKAINPFHEEGISFCTCAYVCACVCVRVSYNVTSTCCCKFVNRQSDSSPRLVILYCFYFVQSALGQTLLQLIANYSGIQRNRSVAARKKRSQASHPLSHRLSLWDSLQARVKVPLNPPTPT